MMAKMGAAKNIVRLLVLVQVGAGLLAVPGGPGGVAALSMDYYGMSCPFAEMMVRSVVYDALMKDPTLAGSLLRLHFHDCFVQGCDASVLIDSTDGNTAEKDALANKSLRGFEVIDRIKEVLEWQCPGVVSCADILALAARDAVLLARGPYYGVPLGRRDGTRSVDSDTFTALPPPFFNTTMLIKLFGSHGFTVQDMVALSGGHTLGIAHCVNFKARLTGTRKFCPAGHMLPSMRPLDFVLRSVPTFTANCSLSQMPPPPAIPAAAAACHTHRRLPYSSLTLLAAAGTMVHVAAATEVVAPTRCL